MMARRASAMGSRRAEQPPLLPCLERAWPAGSRRSVLIAAAALGAGEPGQRVDRGGGVRMRIEADAAPRDDAAPLAGEQRAAKEVGPDFQAIERHSFRSGRMRVSAAWSGKRGAGLARSSADASRRVGVDSMIGCPLASRASRRRGALGVH
jgi:hypothetical protein